jgi:hypothetical protein
MRFELVVHETKEVLTAILEIDSALVAKGNRINYEGKTYEVMFIETSVSYAHFTESVCVDDGSIVYVYEVQ